MSSSGRRRKRDAVSFSHDSQSSSVMSGMSGGGGGGGSIISTAGLDHNNNNIARNNNTASPALLLFYNAPLSAGTQPAAADNHSVFSQGNNSLALDVNSMSAACSSRERPRKKQRLSDVLDNFQFDDDDHGVPDQIVPTGIKRTFTGDSSMGPPNINSYKRLRNENDLDIDDNSQLTASDVEEEIQEGDDSVVSAAGKQQQHRVIVNRGDDNMEEDEEDRKPAAAAQDDDDSTEIEKAQRQAMLDYVLGQQKQIPAAPTDAKIENLFRQSLHNVQKGAHPLQLQGDSDSISQDDMAIDYSSIIAENNSNNNMAMVPQPQPPMRERSNSLPDSMECFDTEGYNGWKDNSGSANVPPVPQQQQSINTSNDVNMDY